MRPARAARSVTVFLVLAFVAAAAQDAQTNPPRRALLLRGANTVKGLPFFPPNAIAALTGAYALDRSASPGGEAASNAVPAIDVWYTREPIVFAPAWKRMELGTDGVAYSNVRTAVPVLAIKAGKYTLFFELASGDDPKARAFVSAFERKFQAFFDNAASDAEISFPAYVDY